MNFHSNTDRNKMTILPGVVYWRLFVAVFIITIHHSSTLLCAAATTTTDTDNDNDSSSSAGPVASAGVNGAFHLRTWADEKFDLNGICDLVLLHNPYFMNNIGMDIHIRSKRTRQWAYISTAVIRIGNDTFEVAGKKDGDIIWINQKPISSSTFYSSSTSTTSTDQSSSSSSSSSGNGSGSTAFKLAIHGFPITFRQLNPDQREYIIHLSNSSSKSKSKNKNKKRKNNGNHNKEKEEETIRIKSWKDMVRVDINNGSAKNFAGSAGLLGSYPNGLHIARDRYTIIDNDNSKFGAEWQVLSTELQLFHTIGDGPQHPMRCDIPTKKALRGRV